MKVTFWMNIGLENAAVRVFGEANKQELEAITYVNYLDVDILPALDLPTRREIFAHYERNLLEENKVTLVTCIYTAELNNAFVEVTVEYDDAYDINMECVRINYNGMNITPCLSPQQIKTLVDQCPIPPDEVEAST